MRTETEQQYVASPIVGGILEAVKRLRELHDDMTLLQAMMFLYVAKTPGISQATLYRDLETNDSGASRILAMLSDIGNRTTPGLDLIRMEVNPKDRRERLCFLTAKGRRLINDIVGEFPGQKR